ncbi:DMT family transporter [Candidatus Dependentiae bacterium]|nr:DMT family transporter [Candidatus Dependentiae bacterium]
MLYANKGIMFAFSAMIIWGFCPILVKLGVKSISSISAFEIRTIGVIFFFLIFSMVSGRIVSYPALVSNNFKTTLYLFLEGFLGAFFGQIMYYTAQKYWDASKTVVVVSAFPVVTLILASIILKEPITIKKTFGIILVLTGFYFIK